MTPWKVKNIEFNDDINHTGYYYIFDADKEFIIIFQKRFAKIGKCDTLIERSLIDNYIDENKLNPIDLNLKYLYISCDHFDFSNRTGIFLNIPLVESHDKDINYMLIGIKNTIFINREFYEHFKV